MADIATVLLLHRQHRIGDFLNREGDTFQLCSISLIRKRKGKEQASLRDSILTSGSGSVSVFLISSRASSYNGWQQGQFADSTAFPVIYLRLRYLELCAKSLLPMGASLTILLKEARNSPSTFLYLSSPISILSIQNINNHMERLLTKLENGQLLTQREVGEVADRAIDILGSEPNVVELASPQFIVGDVHGQFYDFLKMMREVIPPNSNCVFLGDYVDRGYHSVQTICYLLVLKCLRPQGVILLRGNHQTASLTRTYGFYDEVTRKYGNPSVWSRIVEVFTHIPLTALLDHRILCLHGGLSPSTPFLDHIAAIDRFRDIPQSGPMCDLVWSDPDPSDHQGWALNNRGAGFLFSKEVVAQFLRMNGLETIVRAHQLVQEGHVYNFGDRSFVTLWSAPNYCYRCGNEASVMKVDGERQDFLQFHPSLQTDRTKVHFDSLLPYFL